jgi:hypothetical protein
MPIRIPIPSVITIIADIASGENDKHAISVFEGLVAAVAMPGGDLNRDEIDAQTFLKIRVSAESFSVSDDDDDDDSSLDARRWASKKSCLWRIIEVNCPLNDGETVSLLPLVVVGVVVFVRRVLVAVEAFEGFEVVDISIIIIVNGIR